MKEKEMRILFLCVR
jgi:ADP-ribosylation factor-like protein 2